MSNLRQHLLTHSAFKGYTCAVVGCSYSAKLSAALCAHTRRKHRGVAEELRHACDAGGGCTFVTTRPSILRAHRQRMHDEGSLLLACKRPGYAFIAPEYEALLTHIKRHSRSGVAQVSGAGQDLAAWVGLVVSGGLMQSGGSDL